MQSQNERLKEYLQVNKTINPMQAWQILGIYRLSGRVLDLRKRGMNIITDDCEIKNRFGEDCTVALYRLVE